MSKIDSKYINREKLQVSKNILSYFFEVIFYLVAISFWYYMVFKNYETFKEHSDLWRYCILGFPVLLIPNVIRCIDVYINGEIYYFDSALKEIRRNKKIIAVFSDIDYIQIRTLYDSDTPNEYRVSIVFKSGNKIKIEQSLNRENITKVAEDMADILGVKIINK